LPALVVCLIAVGFFSGFYIVPLYTLLQHRAPKTSKGDLIATSNFINVTGAIAASLLFFALVQLAEWMGLARPVPQTEYVEGVLERRQPATGEHLSSFVVRTADGQRFPVGRSHNGKAQHVPITLKADLHAGDAVAVSTYVLRGVDHYEVRPAGEPLAEARDTELVPRFLFIGASLMTLGILILMCRQLPDFFVRALLWLRSHGRYRLKVIGIGNLPSNGPVVLATNCDRLESCMQVLSATDRFTRFILVENGLDEPGPKPWLLRYLAARTGLVTLRAGAASPTAWEKALGKAVKELERGNLVGLTVNGAAPDGVEFLKRLRARSPAPILPVYCDGGQPGTNHHTGGVRVVLGHLSATDASAEEVHGAIRALGDWLVQSERDHAAATTALIPGGPAH
jgi:hypothetical protein